MTQLIFKLFTGFTLLFLLSGNVHGDEAAPPHDSSSAPAITCQDCHALSPDEYILTRGEAQKVKCQSCHNPSGRADQMSEVGNHVVNGGATIIDCGSCHELHITHSTTDTHNDDQTGENQKHIRSDISKWAGDYGITWVSEPVVFHGSSPETYTYSFATAPYNGICQSCHNNTAHHTNSGMDVQHGSGEACTTCHGHSNGFLHGGSMGGGGSGCESCHGSDAQQVGTYKSHSTHIESDDDDLKGPSLDCDSCHDTDSYPNFKQGVDGDGNGTYDLSETTVCDTCHSPGGAFNGVEDLVTGAKINWADGAYDGYVLKAGKEQWCAGCHDDSPANSKADGSGVTAPNVAGDNSTFGYYVTGHGRGSQVSCTHCHHALKKHLDHESQTLINVMDRYDPVNEVEIGTDNPTNYRFYDSKGLDFRYNITGTIYDSEDHSLCYSCHDESNFMDNTTPVQGLVTNFRQETCPTSGNGNFHREHIRGWPYPSCVFCHNPHGSVNPRMANSEPDFNVDIRNLRYDSTQDKYFELSDSSFWNDPAHNRGVAMMTNPTCASCHFTPLDLSGGLDPALDCMGFAQNFYLRSYNPQTYNVYFDIDGDGINDDVDNCSGTSNPGQTDTDSDGVGDICDNCVDISNTDQDDPDSDGAGSACDPCPLDAADDSDGDGICGDADTCPDDPTNDPDNDSVCNDVDICPSVPDAAQGDFDGDSTGDACDLTCDIPSIVPGWIKQFGTTSVDEFPSIAEKDGYLYVAGVTQGQMGDSTFGSHDIFVARYDADGTQIWTEQFGSTDSDKAPDITVDPSSNALYIVGNTVGSMYGTNQGVEDIFIAKYDINGNQIWIRQLGTAVRDGATAVAALNGDVYLTGYTNGDLNGTQGGVDAFLIKYDANGNFLWTRQMGSTSNDGGRDITVDATGNSYITGNWENTSTYFIAKYDTNGNQTWLNQYDKNGGDLHHSLEFDDSETYLYLTSESNYDLFVAQYDISGVEQWKTPFAHGGTGDITVDSDGNAFIMGTTTQNIGGTQYGGNDFFIIKVNSAGAFQWANQYGSSENDYGGKIAVDSNGQLYVAGRTYSDLYGNTNLGYSDIFIMKGADCRSYTPPQPEPSSPAITNLIPADGSSDVGAYTGLTFTLTDIGYGVDWSTFSITLSGDMGYSRTYSDENVPVVSKTGTLASYDVTVNPETDFAAGEIITVTIDIDDNDGNSASHVYSFTVFSQSDSTSPGISNLYPANGDTGVSNSFNATFTLSDNDSGVDWSTFSITFTGDNAFNVTYTDLDVDDTYGTLIATKTGSPASYDVTINRPEYGPFPSNWENITVTVSVDDFAGNPLNSPTWEFTMWGF